MIKTLIFPLLFLISGYAQLKAQSYTLDTITQDFNNDKIIDTLIDDYSSGSTFGGRDVTVIDGKTKEKFALSNYGCYCSFTKLIRVSDSLLLDKNKAFLEVLKEKVVVTKKRDSADATLQWMMSARFGYKEFDDHSYFNLIANPKTNWESRKPYMPEWYHIEVAGDTLKSYSGIDDEPVTENSKGFLTYFTNAHYIEGLDNLQPVIGSENYKIYKTPHSVYVKKGDIYKWLFISDVDVTGAPDKLRWFSINQVELVDNYVIIHQDVPPDSGYNIQVVNIETQRVGRLKFEAHKDIGTNVEGKRTFEIIGGQLVFNIYGVQELQKIPLQELFESLDNYEDD